jgi:arginyl-tRNA--protein-N-Asp/Glu arginylyltransferase
MHVRVVRPDRLSPDELDDYLERGWFRIGQALMTCRVVQFEGGLRPAIWTRLPLESTSFGRSNRKLLARNARLFKIEVAPVTIDDEREELYQLYREIARGERSATLDEFLYGDADESVFDTREVSVRDGNRLVAFSWFDQGREGIQSLIGVYDPAYAKDSLGFTTMLAEVDNARRTGKRYFYPGYVLPGDASMDYKRRIGPLEFFDPDLRTWRDIEDIDQVPLATVRLETALEQARAALEATGVPARVVRYPWFEAPAWQPDLGACLDQPMVVECWPVAGSGVLLLVVYDLDRNTWALLRCLRARAVTRGRSDVDVPIELWLVAERLGSRTTPEAIAGEAARVGSALRLAGT